MTGKSEKQRGDQDSKSRAQIYRQDEPAAEPTRLGDWLSTIKTALRRHLIMSEEAVTAVAFWVVHTYVYREREAVAYVAIQSPEKRCGKTTLLSVLAGMACNPVVASNITVGALFRAIDGTRGQTVALPDYCRNILHSRHLQTQVDHAEGSESGRFRMSAYSASAAVPLRRQSLRLRLQGYARN
jgi:hypothetical protein